MPLFCLVMAADNIAVMYTFVFSYRSFYKESTTVQGILSFARVPDCIDSQFSDELGLSARIWVGEGVWYFIVDTRVP
ncbi:hypothetical protein A9R01_03360 ['Osedax' symbiont bacterium Rs2_46_30_T18]|nr:hypothetical protein A9R01_03360 ['Osedax' symbiont bacterium Rs2_46_30_T18]